MSGYVNRTLGVLELLRTDDHFATCSECVERLKSVLQANQGRAKAVNSPSWELTAFEEDFHLGFEQISAFVEAQLDEIDCEIATSHLALCRNCLEEVEDLQVFRQSLSKQIGVQSSPCQMEGKRWKSSYSQLVR
ncbi:MAG: hypothetical protein JST84_25745 [Acidobacteria bacterium]|nr:hypothetical protein [Acidobacteriota bacterium]